MRPRESNLTAVGRGRSPSHETGLAGVEVVAPDLVGEDLREVQLPVGSHRRRVRSGEVLEQHPRLACARRVDLQQAAAGSELVDEQPPAGVVHRAAVGRREVGAHDPVRAVGVPGGDAPEHRLGREHRPVGTEDRVVGPGDAAAERRRHLVGARLDVDRRHLRPEHLRHVQPPVRPERHPVRPAEPARRRDDVEAPPRRHRRRHIRVRRPAIAHAPILPGRLLGSRPGRPIRPGTRAMSRLTFSGTSALGTSGDAADVHGTPGLGRSRRDYDPQPWVRS